MPFTRNELEHFICTPSQNIEKMVLLDAIQCVSAYLEQAPEVITDIISNHPYIPASCLLEDLAEKIALAQAHSDASQLDSLNALYEFADFQDKLFSADTNGYIFTIYDLKRCIFAIPAHQEDILTQISSDDRLMQRLLTSAIPEAPAETLEALIDAYPNHTDAFTEAYQRNFYTSPSP